MVYIMQVNSQTCIFKKKGLIANKIKYYTGKNNIFYCMCIY